MSNQVRVYFNLHRKVWSVQDAKTRRVIGHAHRLTLSGCTFKVSEAGRQRVLRERKKNVHAFVCGELIGALWDGLPYAEGLPWWNGERELGAHYIRQCADRVSYNPYKAGTFMKGEEPVRRAELIHVGADRVLHAFAAS